MLTILKPIFKYDCNSKTFHRTLIVATAVITLGIAVMLNDVAILIQFIGNYH